MQKQEGIILHKEWFVRDNKDKKIEEFYDFNIKKVI